MQISATIYQFLTDVHWGELDYLIIDTPPGTSDEHITVVEKMRYSVKFLVQIVSVLYIYKKKNLLSENSTVMEQF